MANNSNNISNNSSMFRGLHHNVGSSTQGTQSSSFPSTTPPSNIHYHSPLLLGHLQQFSQSTSFNNSNSNGNSSSTNSSAQTSTTSVSLPAPAPVPGKSGVATKTPESTKHSNPYAGNSKSPANNSDQMLTLVAKLWFEHNLESSLSSLEKDEHDKRIKDLRKQMEFISETNWKYSPVDKFIGQT